VVVTLIISFSYGSGSSHHSKNKNDSIISVDEPEVPEQKIVNTEFTKVQIDVNNVNNAEIILSDGTHKPVPAEFSGKPGESYNVTLHADGYEDKVIPITFVQTSKVYTYSLDKKTDQ